MLNKGWNGMIVFVYGIVSRTAGGAGINRGDHTKVCRCIRVRLEIFLSRHANINKGTSDN